MPARRKALSSSGEYVSGARSRTATSSNGTPARAWSSTWRAISMHSRPSPGAEKKSTPSSASPAGGLAVENRYVRSRLRPAGGSPGAGAASRTAPRSESAATVSPSPLGTVARTLPEARPRAASSVRSAGERSGYVQ